MNLFENLVKAIDITKYIVGSIIIVLCIVIIIIGISGSYNSAALGGPEIEFLLLVGFLLLLACNEGFQVGILGIEHFCNKSIEERECPRTAKIHRIMFTTNGSKLKQLLIGQSFLVVLSSFIIAKLITFPTFPDVEGVNTVVMDIFVRSGLPGAFVTICCAQLLPSMLSKEYPMEFLNIFGVLHVVRLALLIEAVGIVHFVYLLVQMIDHLWDSKKKNSCPTFFTVNPSNYFFTTKKMAMSSTINGNNNNSKNGTTDNNHLKLHQIDDEEVWSSNVNILHLESNPYNTDNRNQNNKNNNLTIITNNTNEISTCQFITEKMKYFLSTALALSCFVFVIFCISKGYSTFNASVSAQFILAACALIVVFYCEGLKVAIVSTSHLTAEAKEYSLYPEAARILELLASRPDGVKRFLLGRQLIVVPLGFLVAQITNFSRFPYNNFPPALYFFAITLGLPGMLILLQFAQLAPQLAAEADGLRFLSKRGVYALTYLALCIEKLGLTSFAWVLYAVVDRVWCRKIVLVIPKKIILEKTEIRDEKRTIDVHDDDDEEDHFVPSKVSFSVITEIGKEEVEDEFRSASTTGTVVNQYIIKTATYSV